MSNNDEEGFFFSGLVIGVLTTACIAGFGVHDPINEKEWTQAQLVCSRYGEELKYIGSTLRFDSSGYEYHIQCNVTQLDLPENQFWIKQQGEEVIDETTQ